MSIKQAQATVTSVAVTATSSTPAALASGAAGMRIIHNISGQILYVRFGGGTASATDHTYEVASGGHLEFPQPVFQGACAVVLASGSGNILVTSY